jgi:Tol biopolymer transport system component/predicted Ser/Thr protein kinase
LNPDGIIPTPSAVTLQPGARLGPYEVLSALGAGGMGEVYKARDTRLARTVAIKILPDALAADPQFRERFDREARAISQLDHPHICPLYDVGEQNGTAFLVMQYLEGETLADRLPKGALPIEQALKTAIEIASALDRAHRAGIVHRDLKPGNIMLTKAGAKLLDFGLAKSSAPVVTGAGLSMLPTTPPNLTAQGTILGTFQYMAPEQIEGQEADVRSDIFAFGVVLYEMVTGKKAFNGKTHASLISSILKDEPRPIVELQPLTPPLLDHIVGRCVAKDPDERWQSASDLTRELRWINESSASARVAASPGAHRERRDRLILGVAAALAGLLLGVAATTLVVKFRSPRSRESPEVVRVLVGIAPAEHLQALPADRTTSEGRPSRTAMVWSPDGRSIVFSAIQGDRQQLYRRALDHLEATPIPGTEGAAGPFFSPDGRWVGFWSGGALKKVLVDGSGPATTICETPAPGGATWGSDDTIIFSRQRDGLWRVSAAGGTAQSLAKPDANKGELKFVLPQILPGDRAILFTVTHSPFPTWDDTEIVVQSLATGERTTLITGGADGRYLRSGHLVYLRRGTLTAVPFDRERLAVAGGAVALIADVMQAANTPNEQYESGAGQFSVSESGSLLYLPGGLFPDPARSLVWVDRTGALQPLALPARAYLSPRLSPDGRRVVLWTQGDRNIWIHDLTRGTLTRFTSEARNARAIWTPDGTRVTYGSATGGNENIFWKPADGSGPAERLTTGDTASAASWSPDGQTLVFVQQPQGTGTDIWILPLSGDRRPRALLQTRFNEAYPDVSPDGRWLAFATDESGRSEVYVQPYPGPGPRQQISTDGGTAPAWSRDGRELFYTTTQTVGGQATLTRMMAVPVEFRPTITAGTPRMIFEGKFGASANIRGYDVTPDGRRFLMVQQKERPAVSAADMILVQNWFEELKARVPTK